MRRHNPEIAAEFEKWWTPPQYKFFTDEGWGCHRCGAFVFDQDAHTQYHQNISLNFFLHGRYIIEHTKHHELLEAVFDQLTNLFGSRRIEINVPNVENLIGKQFQIQIDSEE